MLQRPSFLVQNIKNYPLVPEAYRSPLLSTVSRTPFPPVPCSLQCLGHLAILSNRAQDAELIGETCLPFASSLLSLLNCNGKGPAFISSLAAHFYLLPNSSTSAMAPYCWIPCSFSSFMLLNSYCCPWRSDKGKNNSKV